ncbi:RnfABCDGE type electron transport complex subunit B [Ruminococcaceae bacterium OttesenSCG-928-I18]|nr:RnfABCDGE type electron transport complex subunit B [Ruminococcaceae bacterium OttesenSCG-928-I18]
MAVTSAVIIVSLTGLCGAAILVVASQLMHVEVDERIGLVQEALPGANCGACGYAGCADYATAIIESGAEVNLCIPGGASVAEEVGRIAGRDAGGVAQRKAIVACQGTEEHRSQKYENTGLTTCTASAALYGGPSACPYGCLGYGDCKEACKFDAIEIQHGVARINMEKCTGCGACEEACPKRVIWIREVSEKPVVMCANHQRGAMTRKVCTAGCIGCMKCQKTCPTEAIVVKNNVARIDLEKCIGCRKCVNDCPVKAIAVPKIT